MSNEKKLIIKETFDLAFQNHQNNKLDVAQDLYSQILKINPNYAEAHFNLGAIFRELGENQKAKDCYEKAIEINPNYTNALNNLGNIFKELGENQKAKDCYEKAIVIDPNYADALNNLGVVFKELRENEKAKNCYEKALEIDPLNKKYMVEYGYILLIFDDKVKGYEYIKKGAGVIKFTPSYSKII